MRARAGLSAGDRNSVRTAALIAAIATGIVVLFLLNPPPGKTAPQVPPWLRGTSTYTIPLSAATQDATGVAGDPGGSGTATITLNADTNQVCATTSWSGIDTPVVWGHIHAGAYGQPENPAFTLTLFGPNLNGAPNPVSSCSTATAAQIGAIRRCPKEFNVVVHSKGKPVGAIRGQFGTACNL